MDARNTGGRWGTVAASVMRRPGLSVAAKAVYAALSTYADRIGWIWVRQETIAADLERSRTWVHSAIAELEREGLIMHDRQFIEGRQRASRYRLLDGLPRCAEAQPESQGAPLSERPDAAVEPADTDHYDDKQDSLPGERVRERALSRGDESHADPCPVPPDWVPTAADVSWAMSKHPNLDVLAFTEAFVLSCCAKDYRYADISSAWRRWLVEPKGRLPLIATAAKPNQDSRHDRSEHRAPSTAAAGLAEDNASRAAAVLERIMARRAGYPPAGPAA
jgi:biotin operon repressor